jgi:pimeloyl-ACP methyl ester carboxylesterase
MTRRPGFASSCAALCAAIASLVTPLALAAGPPFEGAQPCRLSGVAGAAWCGVVQRPLRPPDAGATGQPSGAAGPSIEVHVAVVPALARVKRPDPVVFLAGGPGQSAVDLAGPALAMVGRLSNRRDLVLIDQRGTGRSAPLSCPEDGPGSAWQPLSQLWNGRLRMDKLERCREALMALPHGDLRQYTTAIAVGDLLAVLDRLGVREFNLLGASYGTRVGLEVMRQAPERVRRAVLDGVVPADMQLPQAGERDAETAWLSVLGACAEDAGCKARWPDLAARWSRVLAALPHEVVLDHPLSGMRERVLLDRETVLGLVRSPLYAPALAAQLPAAIAAATEGRWSALAGVAASLQTGGRRGGIATGQHFSVVCSEDLAPGVTAPIPAPTPTPTPADGNGWGLAAMYAQACARWPRASLAPGWGAVPAGAGAVWLLSGGLDPVTPPRHGERVREALGERAVHTVVANAGHGVLALPCLREAVVRFVDAPDHPQAAQVARDERCGDRLPRPRPFVPPHAGPETRP